MSEIKNFNDRQGNTLALAAADDKYMIGGALVDKMQSEKVPFFITTYAMDIPRGITMYALTDEFYTTYKNKLLKMTASGLPGVVTTSFRNFVEPEDYLQQFAEALSQMKLTPMAQADLPSYMGQNRDTVYNNMMAEYNAAFEMEAAQGAPTYANNTICKSVLVRYTGTSAAGVDSVVLAGMDYQGVEYYTTASAIGPLGTLFKGLQKTKSSTQFGHGTPCDAIDWGAVNKFLLITPAQYEQETTSDFIDFVSTFHMEPNLRARFYQAREARKMQLQQEIQAQNAMLQAQLAQSRASLAANQQRLAQTLAANSEAMHVGIMDSWNRKMASDSRISQARSEAIRGVDTYTNSYGQDVEVSVTADHVYQNQYGDVYGVSGPAPDNETLNRLNWTEIQKK